MAFSRNSMVAAVAGTLSLAMLTGCPNPGTPNTGSSPSTDTSASPTTAPSDGATTTPTEAPSGTPVSAEPSASKLEPTTVRGTVYDEKGATVDGATVHIVSLNPSNSFDNNYQVVSGSYVANEVPAGVQLRITVSKDGWTTRERVETLLPLSATDPSGNKVNFGGTGDVDKEGQSYFISDRPEVSMTEPADDADNVDPTKMTVKLTLSEALDEDNRSRFERAVRIVPFNKEAGAAVGEINAANAATAAAAVTGYYDVRDGSVFLDTDNTADVTWDADGKVATLTFNAAYKQDKSTASKYQIALQAPDTEAIKDKSGKVLGTNSDSAFSSDYTKDGFVLHAFKATSLSINDGKNDVQRWNNTHDNAAVYSTPIDDQAPTLTGISVSGDNLISLTFSEPMVAYMGSETATGSALVPENYTFRVSDTSGGLDGTTWDDAKTATAVASWAAVLESTKTFKLGASIATVEVSTSDPKVIRFRAHGSDKFAIDPKQIKVRVDEAVKDPAGNAVKTSGDANFQAGTL